MWLVWRLQATGNWIKQALIFSDLSPSSIHPIARSVGVMMVDCKVNMTQLKSTQAGSLSWGTVYNRFPVGYLWGIVLTAIFNMGRFTPDERDTSGIFAWLVFSHTSISLWFLADTEVSSFKFPGRPRLRASKTLEAFSTTLRFLSYSGSRNRQPPRFGHFRCETAVVGLF